MKSSDIVGGRYTAGRYLGVNPTWDIEDSPWKASQVARMIRRHGLVLRTLVDIGCGAGGVLAELRSIFPDARLCGFDIAPDAATFWPQHAGKDIEFHVGDFLESDSGHYDLLLLLDVLEHLSDPFNFLARLKGRADRYIFHVPLDLSALTVLRETPLLQVRKTVGHIHYFTKRLAIALLADCGYQVLDCSYTDAALRGPRQSWKTRLARLPRRIAYAVHKDLGVRLLGGETLMILAQAGRA